MGQKLPHLRMLWTSLILAMGGNFHYGYQISIVNPTKVIFQEFMNESFILHYDRPIYDHEYRLLWSFLINVLVIGAMAALPLVPLLGDRLGRRPSMAIASGLFVVCSIPMYIAQKYLSFTIIIFARFMYGVACGLSAGINSFYISEISTDHNRGLMSATTGLFVEFGFAASAFIGLPTVMGNREEWPNMFLVESIPSLLLLVCLPFIPESPKFLLARGQAKAAKRSIAVYESNPEIVEATLRNIDEELQLESQAMSIRQLLQSQILRKGLVLGCTVSFVAEFCGITAIDNFTTYFMMQAGLDHRQAAVGNIVVAVFSMVAGVSSIFAMDHFGRRPLLIGTGIALFCVNMVFMISFKTQELTGEFPGGPGVILVSSCLFMLFISFGWGPIEWFLAGELVPHNARSSATALSHFTLYVAVFLAGSLYLPLEGIIGAYTFLIFIIPIFIGTLVVAKFLPETKGRAITEIMLELNPRIAVKDLSLDSIDELETEKLEKGRTGSPDRQRHG